MSKDPALLKGKIMMNFQCICTFRVVIILIEPLKVLAMNDSFHCIALLLRWAMWPLSLIIWTLGMGMSELQFTNTQTQNQHTNKEQKENSTDRPLAPLPKCVQGGYFPPSQLSPLVLLFNDITPEVLSIKKDTYTPLSTHIILKVWKGYICAWTRREGGTKDYIF